MNEKSSKNKFISKRVFWVLLCCFLVIGFVTGGIFLREAYINNQPHDMIVKTKTSGVWVFEGTEHFFSINTQFSRKVEIDKSKYEEVKDTIIGSSEFNSLETILFENNIVFNSN